MVMSKVSMVRSFFMVVVSGEEVVPHELEGSEGRWRMQQQWQEPLRKTLIVVLGYQRLTHTLEGTDLWIGSRHEKTPTTPKSSRGSPSTLKV